jgi:CHAT domain-containing protein
MLAPDEALVEFLLTETRGFAWVVRSGAVTAYDVPGQDALLPRVRLLQALVAANDAPAIERLGSELYAQLLAPAAPALDGARRLVLVPDGVLQRVPFALLRADGRWLLERHALTVAPSATVLDHLRRSAGRTATRPLLALALPAAPDAQAALFDLAPGALATLGHASAEARDAASALGASAADTHLGAAATEHVMKAPTAAQYRVVHLAAHAVVDEVMPRRSAVLLSPGDDDDGVLRVSEIAHLSLDADLVVLAACRTNVGRMVRGEGLLSLSRAFLHAGARAVMATAWTVDDRETAWLMREFYRGLGDGLAPDHALQHAQRRAIASGGSHASPAHWGAFVLIGDARTPVVPGVSGTATREVLLTAGAAGTAVAIAIGWWRRRSRRRSPHAEARRC